MRSATDSQFSEPNIWKGGREERVAIWDQGRYIVSVTVWCVALHHHHGFSFGALITNTLTFNTHAHHYRDQLSGTIKYFKDGINNVIWKGEEWEIWGLISSG